VVLRRTARTRRAAATYALGQRVEDVPAVNMNVWPQEIIYDPAGQLLGHYFNFPPQRDWWHIMVPALGRIMVESEQWYVGNAWIYHYDALGSALEATDHTGAPLQDTLHYPWGQVWQGGTGLFYMQCQLLPCFDQSQTRDYPPTLGRWMSPDPLAGDISNPQSLNRYAYALNNPTSASDPTGLDCHQFGTCAQTGPHPVSCTNMNCAWQYYSGTMPAFFRNPTGAAVMTCYVDGVPTGCANVIEGMNNGSLYPLPPRGDDWEPFSKGSQPDCPGCYKNSNDQTWDPDNPRTSYGPAVYLSTLSPDAQTVLKQAAKNTSTLTTAEFWVAWSAAAIIAGDATIGFAGYSAVKFAAEALIAPYPSQIVTATQVAQGFLTSGAVPSVWGAAGRGAKIIWNWIK